MMTFRGGRLGRFKLPTSSVWLMTDIAEAKGRQELHSRQSPQVLKVLREIALIQSAESSNRIEGVEVSRKRLRPLVLGTARPRDRSEEEVQGYRRALNLIHTRSSRMSVSGDVFLRLHRTIQEGSGDAGEWKRVENVITEVHPGRPPRVRFRPVPVRKTPGAVKELCLSYRHALDQEKVPALLAVACLVFDFLCIHPFRDGNGRVARLLTLLALYQHGYEVGRYISLERLVEESKEDYYEVLERCSKGWHEGRHDIVPWLNYLLAGVRRAYVQFEARAGEVTSRKGAKSAMILQAIEAQEDDFTVRDLQRSVPGASLDLIRRVLGEERKAGRVKCVARGRDARWRRIR